MSLSLVKFNPKNEFKTVLKSSLGFGYLYMDFSKMGFGFGEISVHQRDSQNGAFSAMNEMMPRETCADIITSFVMSLPKKESVRVVRHEDGFEFLSKIKQEVEKDTLSIINLYLSRNPNNENILHYIPSLNFSEIKFNTDEGTVTANLNLDNDGQNYFVVTLNYDLIDGISFFSPFYARFKSVTSEQLTNWVLNKEDELFYNGEEIKTYLSSIFYFLWLKDYNAELNLTQAKNKFSEIFQDKKLIKSLEYYEVQGNTLEGKIVSAQDRAVKELQVSFVSNPQAHFCMKVVADGQEHEISIKTVEGLVNGASAYCIENTGDERLIYNAFTKILADLILEDQEHMDYRDLYVNVFSKFQEVDEIENVLTLLVNSEKESVQKREQIIKEIAGLKKLLTQKGVEKGSVDKYCDRLQKQYIDCCD